MLQSLAIVVSNIDRTSVALLGFVCSIFSFITYFRCILAPVKGTTVSAYRGSSIMALPVNTVNYLLDLSTQIYLSLDMYFINLFPESFMYVCEHV